MANILSGSPVKEQIKQRLIDRVQKLGKKLVLVIVQVGDRADSNIYIKNKIKFGEEIGVKVTLCKFDDNISEEELEREVKNISADSNINGIIVQLPLPKKINTEKILNLIPANKDADGLAESSAFLFGRLASLTEASTRNFSAEKYPCSQKEMPSLITPATARAVMSLLDFYKIELKGRKVAVVGRSKLAGGPIAKSLEERGAEVFVCHRETENTEEICRSAEILVSAAGQVNLINKNFVNKDQVVIDVGINRVEKDDKFEVVGDVNFTEVEPLVKAISPVPGGVGLITVSCLFENLLDLDNS